MFGERDGKLAQRLMQGFDRNLVGDGENTIDFVHVTDVARGARAALCEGESLTRGQRTCCASARCARRRPSSAGALTL